MSDLHLLDLAEIARREELRQAQGLAEVVDDRLSIAGGTVGRAAAGSWLNNAVGLGFSGEVSRADVDRLAAFHEQVGAEPRVEVAPYAHPSLHSHLGEAGFRIASDGGWETVLFRQLKPGEPVHPIVPTPPEVRLGFLDAADPEAVRAYAEMVCAAFFPPGVAPSEADLEASARCVRHPATRAAVAWIDGQMVGGGTMALHEGEIGIAALFGLAVRPEFRRRGIQQALIALRLNEAIRRGVFLATIGSRPGMATERNVRRMGFSVAYSKVILVRPGPGLRPVKG